MSKNDFRFREMYGRLLRERNRKLDIPDDVTVLVETDVHPSLLPEVFTFKSRTMTSQELDKLRKKIPYGVPDHPQPFIWTVERLADGTYYVRISESKATVDMRMKKDHAMNTIREFTTVSTGELIYFDLDAFCGPELLFESIRTHEFSLRNYGLACARSATESIGNFQDPHDIERGETSRLRAGLSSKDGIYVNKALAQ
jgi:hypothetical protein